MKSRYPCQDHSSRISPLAEIRISHHKVMIRWKPTRRKQRQYLLYAFLLFLCFLLLSFHDHIPLGSAYSGHWTQIRQRSPNPLYDKHVSLWRSLHSLIRNNNPQCNKKPDLVLPHDVGIPFDSGHHHPRPDLLWIDDADVTRLKSAHANFVLDVRSHDLHLAYETGTRGIVTLTSETLLSTLTVSLRMLRKTTSTLPVEVFLRSPSPQSDVFCSKILPSLGAKCSYLSDVFNAAETAISPTMQQSKVLAILFSTFEEVLFLDPCSFPVTAPEPLFHSVPFADTGLVLWPDFWYQSQSPYYFDVAKILEVPLLNTRAASQSNEMMYSKAKHARSLMLAAYYNFHGPEYYYLLQSQGAPGAGEKETFGAAAEALGEPVYHVSRPVRSLGRHDAKDNWMGTGMSQHDPVADFFVYRHKRPAVMQSEDIVRSSLEQQRAAAVVRPVFVHADALKFDPRIVLEDGLNSINSAIRNEAGESSRSWMPETEAISQFGFDVERRYWSEIEKAVCGELLGLWLESGRPDRRVLDLVKRRDTQLCEKVQLYNKEVFAATKV